jgi:splicing factor 3B subunit 3
MQIEGGFIRLYTMEEGRKLTLLHKTAVEGIPRALASFQGRLLAGVGNVLRLYDVGKKKLLRKCENRHLPSLIVTIDSMGDRIYVGDCQVRKKFRYSERCPIPTR